MEDDEQETAHSWTNPWIAEYKRRQAMLMEMRSFEVIAMMRDLNLTSYAFSKNAEELQTHATWPHEPDTAINHGIPVPRAQPT